MLGLRKHNCNLKNLYLVAHLKGNTCALWHNCNLKNLCSLAHLEGSRGNCAAGEVFDQTLRGHARRVTHKDDLHGLH